MDIVRTIEKHLRCNRRLVVPSFGAFVVKESGEVLFSELLKADDGVLHALLATEGLGELERDGAIDRLIFEVKYALEHGGVCTFGTLGRFERGANGAAVFSGNIGNVPCDEAPAQPAGEVPAAEPKRIVAEPAPAEPVRRSLTDLYRDEEEPAVAAQVAAPQPKGGVEPEAPRRKRGTDWFIVIAVAVLLAALAVIGYGYWCSRFAGDDDAEMEALRWRTEQSAAVTSAQ